MTFFVGVNWNKDADYSDTGEDVTNRVRPGSRVTVSYGRDQNTSLAPVVAGRGSFDLDNRSKDYSPLFASSPLFGNLKPARPVLIQRTVSATTHTIFRGHTDDSPINPDVDAKTVTLSLVDTLADFRGQKITTALHQGLRTGAAIGLVLDAVGWTGGRDLDTGATVMPWWWAEGEDAFDAMQKILASEGSPALLTIDAAGAVVFRDRHHRLIRTASTTSQSTWRGSGATEPVMGKGFTYSDSWANVVNNVTFAVEERAPLAALTAVWETDEIITLAASEARVIPLQTSDPFKGAVTPVAGTDFTILAGGVSSVSISRTSGAASSITITATAAGATISGMALRAFSVPVARTYQVTKTNTASVTDYGQRGVPAGMEPVWASRGDAQAIADLLILQRAQPLPVLTVRFTCGTGTDARLTALLVRDLSDRVTIIEPETAVNGDFFIESIAHSFDGITDHEIVFGCEAVPAAPTNPFILGTSLLGTGTLAY